MVTDRTTSSFQGALVWGLAPVFLDFRRRDCDHVGKFAKIVSDNLDWLVKHGHPKWRSVELSAPLKGWEQ